MNEALLFVVRTLIDLYILTFILRFLLQLVRADFHNPLSQFIVRVTNPLVRPLRRIVPGWGGLDIATLIATLVLEILATAVLFGLQVGAMPDPPRLMYYSLLRLITTVIRLYFFAIIVQVILSWVSPGLYNPITAILWKLTDPLLRPVRRLLPPIGGIDLSPLFVIIGLQAQLMIVPLPRLLA